MKTANPEIKWGRIAGRFRERAVHDKLGRRRDRTQGDEKTAFFQAHQELGWSPSQLGRLFGRDARIIAAVIQGQDQARQRERERERLAAITLPARQSQMRSHYGRLANTCRAVASQLAEFNILFLWQIGELTATIRVEDEPLFECLRQHKPASPVWNKLAGWKRKAASLISTCDNLLREVEQAALAESDLGPLPDFRSAGLHPNFWGTVYTLALYESKGQHPWDYEEVYVPARGLTVLRCGAYGVAAADPRGINRLRELHITLRREFAGSAEVQEILRQERDLVEAQARISSALDEMLLVAFSESACHICSQWLT